MPTLALPTLCIMGIPEYTMVVFVSEEISPLELNQWGYLTKTAAMNLVCTCLQNVEKSSRESETNTYLLLDSIFNFLR